MKKRKKVIKIYKVECIKDYGMWAKKGKIMEVRNDTANIFSKKGILKKLKFLGDYKKTDWHEG